MSKPKLLFIETYRKADNSSLPPAALIKDLPKTIYLAYSIQYKSYAQKVKDELSKEKKILGFSQVLGCSKIKTDADAILLIGSGRFHALGLAVSSNKEVYILENNNLSKITKEEINQLLSRRKAQIKKFFSSTKIGILVSLKPGQCNYNLAKAFAQKLKANNKKPTIFIADDFNLSEMENYPIECWVNAACPGLELDKHMINLRDLTEYI